MATQALFHLFDRPVPFLKVTTFKKKELVAPLTSLASKPLHSKETTNSECLRRVSLALNHMVHHVERQDMVIVDAPAKSHGNLRRGTLQKNPLLTLEDCLVQVFMFGRSASAAADPPEARYPKDALRIITQARGYEKQGGETAIETLQANGAGVWTRPTSGGVPGNASPLGVESETASAFVGDVTSLAILFNGLARLQECLQAASSNTPPALSDLPAMPGSRKSLRVSEALQDAMLPTLLTRDVLGRSMWLQARPRVCLTFINALNRLQGVFNITCEQSEISPYSDSARRKRLWVELWRVLCAAANVHAKAFAQDEWSYLKTLFDANGAVR